MPISRRTAAPRLLRATTAAVMISAVAAPPVAMAASDPATVQSKLTSAQQHARSLRQSLHGDQAKIAAYQRRIDELQQQLAPLDSGLQADRRELDALQTDLRTARARVVRLKAELARDRQALSAQLAAQYESPTMGLADVVVDARGFPDLLSRVDQVREIAAQNARVTTAVRDARASEASEAEKLTAMAARQRALVATEAAKRDAVAHLKLQVVQQQVVYVRARNSKSGRLATLRGTQKALEKQLDKIQRLQFGGSLSGGTSPGGYGFFPAAGTNYGVHDEPRLAQKLTVLGQTLHLHLIGLSGYRTPAHSVEVGGFANDPHTRGEASDTPGIEGVPEATLNRFGLTRPFAGAAEADHVQLVGSAR